MRGGRAAEFNKDSAPIHSRVQNGRRANGRKTGCGRGVLTFFLPCLILFSFSLFILTAAYASGGGGSNEGPSWFNFTWRGVNFLILAGVLYWLLAKKVKAFFTGRREGIRTALADADGRDR
jgi:hypothetical protein